MLVQYSYTLTANAKLFVYNSVHVNEFVTLTNNYSTININKSD